MKTEGPPERPWWVACSLCGIRRRQGAQWSFGASFALALAAAVAGMWFRKAMFFVPVGLLAAWWYWHAIRWVDVHDRWDP